MQKNWGGHGLPGPPSVYSPGYTYRLTKICIKQPTSIHIICHKCKLGVTSNLFTQNRKIVQYIYKKSVFILIWHHASMCYVCLKNRLNIHLWFKKIMLTFAFYLAYSLIVDILYNRFVWNIFEKGSTQKRVASRDCVTQKASPFRDSPRPHTNYGPV